MEIKASDSRQSVDAKWKLRKTLEKFITVFDGDLNIGPSSDEEDFGGSIYLYVPLNLQGNDSLDAHSVSAKGYIDSSKVYKLGGTNFATLSGSGFYIGNKSSSTVFVSDKSDSDKYHFLFNAKNGATGALIDSFMVRTINLTGTTKESTQQWFSDKTFSSLYYPTEFFVTVESGSDHWSGSFVLYGNKKVEVAFPMPTSTTEVVWCRAKLVSDSSEGAVGSLKVDFDSMTLSDGYSVSVKYRTIGF